MTADLYKKIRDEERQSIGERPLIGRAVALFDRLTLSDQLEDFLTIPAYEELLGLEQGGSNA